MKHRLLLIWDRALAKRVRRAIAQMWIRSNRTALRLDADVPITIHKSYSDSIVASTYRDGTAVVIKIPRNSQAAQSLRRHSEVTQWLRERLAPELGELIPETIEVVTVRGKRVLIETALDGIADGRFTTDARAKHLAFQSLDSIHKETSTWDSPSSEDLRSLVHHPISVLRGWSPSHLYPGLDRLEHELESALSSRLLSLACTHGDFFPPNILFDGDSTIPSIRGIIDWETGHTRGLPETDFLGWMLLSDPVGRTPLMVRLLGDEAEATRSIGRLPFERSNPSVSTRVLLLLTWLGQVASTAERVDFGSARTAWFSTEVTPVIAQIRSNGVSN